MLVLYSVFGNKVSRSFEFILRTRKNNLVIPTFLSFFVLGGLGNVSSVRVVLVRKFFVLWARLAENIEERKMKKQTFELEDEVRKIQNKGLTIRKNKEEPIDE